MGKRVFLIVSIMICIFANHASYSKSLDKSHPAYADSLNINQDFSQRNPLTSKNVAKVQPDSAAITDTTKRYYKFLQERSHFISSDYHSKPTERDHQYHRHIEDFFSNRSHVYLHDKMEYGQFNDLFFGGLGMSYQVIWLDDILLNDPISMKAPYQSLSSESFSSLNLFQGYQALSLSPYPISLQSKTAKLVAAKGYTKISYFQFIEGNLKTDVTFSLNLSERLNFFTNYVRESTDGRYNNLNSFSVDRYASSYEGNKFNIQFRYQLGLSTYFTLADYLILFQQRPYGGVDYATSLALDLNPLDPLSAVVKNQFLERYHFDHTIKAQFESSLPFFSDSTNQFKAWLAYSTFQHDYEKKEPSVVDSTVFNDRENSSRITLGLSDYLNFEFWKLDIRALALHDKIQEQNTLRNQDSLSISPTYNRLWFNASSHFNLQNLIFNHSIEAFGSLSLSREMASGTSGQDMSTSLLGFGVGGLMTFEIPHWHRDDSFMAFFNLSTTHRMPSLKEVFSSGTGIEGKQNWTNEKVHHFDVGARLKLHDDFSLRLSYLFNRVESPLVVIQTIDADSSSQLNYSNLDTDNLTYSGIGLEAKFNYWKFNTTLNLTSILSYELLDNPNRNYASGIVETPSVYDDASTNQVLYLPKHRLSFSIFYNDSFFENALQLKAGFSGFIMSPVSASLQNNERHLVYYFNLLNRESELTDNNLQNGAQGICSQLDFQLWADIGSAVVTVFVENLFDSTYFTSPFFYANQRALRLGFTWRILD